MKKQDLKAVMCEIIGIFIFVLLMLQVGKVFVYPELYITSWKYQLQMDLQNGNADAVEYYQKKYVKNGIALF